MSDQVKKESKQIKIICPECSKPKVSKGSITGWLFSESHCTCFSGGLPLAVPPTRAVDRSQDQEGNLPQGILGDNYEFLSSLGRGGMGSVYRIRDQRKGKEFAVKILNAEIAGNPDGLKRFYKECEALAQLTHPNVVAVYGHGQTVDGYPYLLMDYIDGYSLADVLEQDIYLNVGRGLGLFIPIAEALSYAHEQGILHRDLKPGNIMITRSETEETIRLVDFGLAKALEGNNRVTQDLTQTGDVLGTPLYMSPEQCLGFQLDERSDIYSFGCLMCETLTGKPPFTGDNPMQIVAHHLSESPIEASYRLDNMGIPTGLQDIILTCLHKDGRDRYPDFGTLIEDLKSVVAGKRPVHSTSRVSHKLRSPYVGMVLELLPFSFPVSVFAIIYAIQPFSGSRVDEHCVVASLIASLLFVFYFAKAHYLKASSTLLDKSGVQYATKVRTFFVTSIMALLFIVSQIFVYLDYRVLLAASKAPKIDYSHPWYFVLLWLTLSAIPFLVHVFYRKERK